MSEKRPDSRNERISHPRRSLCKEFKFSNLLSSNPRTISNPLLDFAMGSSGSKNKSTPFENDNSNVLREKMRLMQEEMKETRCKREKESRVYGKQARVFEIKEGEWKREKKRLREEVRRWRKRVEEKEERIRGLMEGKREQKEWQLLETNFVVEQMREEQARRDATVQRWKQLYLAIKTELDDLIQRTHRGEREYWGVEEEEMMEGLQMELKSKEETIKVLKARLVDMDQKEANRKREVDILRQSLRIMSNAKRAPSVTKSLSRSFCSSKRD